jgi:hypothetical protein
VDAIRRDMTLPTLLSLICFTRCSFRDLDGPRFLP